MVDISSRDEEDAREREIEQEKGRSQEQEKLRNSELAQEKGRKQEQDKVREHELAQEKGRRQGAEEERSRQKGKNGMKTGTMAAIGLIVIVLVVALAAFLTLSTSVTSAQPGGALPYTTMYGVTFPEGQTITIGNSQISVLSYQGELISDIDGDRQKLLVGEDRTITERRAVATTLGAVKLMDTNFVINLKYKGNRHNQAYFDMAVHTSKQVPDMLIQKLLPREINAQPM